MRIRTPQGNFDIYFITPYILTENPHLALIIQCIDNRTLRIVMAFQFHYDAQTLHRSYAQFQETILILLSVVAES